VFPWGEADLQFVEQVDELSSECRVREQSDQGRQTTQGAILLQGVAPDPEPGDCFVAAFDPYFMHKRLQQGLRTGLAPCASASSICARMVEGSASFGTCAEAWSTLCGGEGQRTLASHHHPWSIGVMTTVIIVVGVVVVVLLLVTLAARRSGYSGVGGDTVVRCQKGDLFLTIWTPGVSLKAVRLGLTRFQWCPVGKHLSIVRLVNDSELTDEQRREAAQHHDLRVP